jgi:hypothetical protein
MHMTVQKLTTSVFQSLSAENMQSLEPIWKTGDRVIRWSMQVRHTFSIENNGIDYCGGIRNTSRLLPNHVFMQLPAVSMMLLEQSDRLLLRNE